MHKKNLDLKLTSGRTLSLVILQVDRDRRRRMEGNDRVRVALIYVSSRKGRWCDKVAQWAAAQIGGSRRFEVTVVNPMTPVDIQQRLESADAFIVVTPEYNHGYPAPLKELIDSFGSEWHAKPVAFVSYGGISGGLRAVEQLRQVFAELHAMTIRDSVAFPNAWEQFGDGDRSQDFGRAERSMTVMLGRLHWWAVALRIARSSFS